MYLNRTGLTRAASAQQRDKKNNLRGPNNEKYYLGCVHHRKVGGSGLETTPSAQSMCRSRARSPSERDAVVEGGAMDAPLAAPFCGSSSGSSDPPLRGGWVHQPHAQLSALADHDQWVEPNVARRGRVVIDYNRRLHGRLPAAAGERRPSECPAVPMKIIAPLYPMEFRRSVLYSDYGNRTIRSDGIHLPGPARMHHSMHSGAADIGQKEGMPPRLWSRVLWGDNDPPPPSSVPPKGTSDITDVFLRTEMGTHRRRRFPEMRAVMLDSGASIGKT